MCSSDLIDDLREKRTYLPERKTRVHTTKETLPKDDPRMVFIASLPPDERAELLTKLGISE